MNNKIIIPILILVIAVVIGYFYLADGEITQPIDENAEFGGTWSSEFVITDTDGNQHVLNPQSIIWEGYDVGYFTHNLGINPTNKDDQPGEFSTITIDMPWDSYTSQYSLIEKSTGTKHVDHASLDFEDSTGIDIDGEYQFDVDSGTQFVGTQEMHTDTIETFLEYASSNPGYGEYDLQFHLSGEFQYYVDSTNDWKTVTLPESTATLTIEWQQDIFYVVDIEWDTTSQGNS